MVSRCRTGPQFVVRMLILLACFRPSSFCISIGEWREFDLETRVFMADIVAYVEVVRHYHFDFSDEYTNVTWPNYPYSEFGYISLFKILCHYYGEELPLFLNVTGAGTRSESKCTNEEAEVGRRYIAFLFRSDNYEEFGYFDDIEIDPINKQESLIEPNEESFRLVHGVCKVTPKPVHGHAGECPFAGELRTGSCYSYDDYAARYIEKTENEAEMARKTTTAAVVTATIAVENHHSSVRTIMRNSESPLRQDSVNVNSAASIYRGLTLVFLMVLINRWVN